MVAGVFDELARERPRRRFTIGINDDVSGTSLAYDAALDIEPPDTVRAVFFGLGSDGTVGANKNTIKILGPRRACTRRATSSTTRRSPARRRSRTCASGRSRSGRRTSCSRRASSAATSSGCSSGSTCSAARRPARRCCSTARTRRTRSGTRCRARCRSRSSPSASTCTRSTPAGSRARSASPGGPTSSCRPASSPSPACCRASEAIERIKEAIEKTYGRRGAEVVARNQAAVDRALDGLHRVEVPEQVTATRGLPPVVPAHAPEFVRTVTAEMMAGRGDELPVSALPVDGTYPSGTAAYEKRNISELVAVWDSDLCIQCGNCSFVCPHSVIRSKYYDQVRPGGRARTGSGRLRSRPSACPTPATRCRSTSRTAPAAGCASRPARSSRRATRSARRSTSRPREPLVAAERDNIAFFETLPANDRSRVDFGTVRGTQFLEPLFEFSGACAGCGETPYLKLLSQLFGDRLMVANATGCSSIYGGNLPTTPWTTDADGRGPAWSNSLFEDNAEFGLGFRLAADRHTELARRRLAELRDAVGAGAGGRDPRRRRSCGSRSCARQRERVAELKRRLDGLDGAAVADLLQRRRPPGPAQRLDRRRRRLGLRHRLRRARPRPGQRARRQRAGARHRGLLQHRRPDVEGDAARRGRQVRRRRQDRAQEGPRPAGDRLRQRLRRPGRDGRRSPADAATPSARRRPTTGPR